MRHLLNKLSKQAEIVIALVILGFIIIVDLLELAMLYVQRLYLEKRPVFWMVVMSIYWLVLGILSGLLVQWQWSFLRTQLEDWFFNEGVLKASISLFPAMMIGFIAASIPTAIGLAFIQNFIDPLVEEQIHISLTASFFRPDSE